MSPPLLSVATPCLNSAATISETLASVRAQGLGDRVEHVIVDGGSTDGTVPLLEEAGVRFVSEPDRGLSDAMNKGLALAEGAQNAREHGAGHPAAVFANRVVSRLIVLVYWALRAVRERRSR